MEAVGAAASILGILGFTIQALKVISQLKEFCSEFSDDTTAEFLHNLEISAGTIMVVKVFCERLDESVISTEVEFRVVSLQIQIEDCARDLENWLDLGYNMKRERTRGRKRDGALRFFDSFVKVTSQSSRMKAHERFRWHKKNLDQISHIRKV
jgi:hypothetical protein